VDKLNGFPTWCQDSAGNAAAYSVTANTRTTVAPAASCTISVRYAPTALGSQVGSLVIPHDAAGGSTTVSLTGTGAGSSLTLTPNPNATAVPASVQDAMTGTGK
jgi:hypothetical protein